MFLGTFAWHLVVHSLRAQGRAPLGVMGRRGNTSMCIVAVVLCAMLATDVGGAETLRFGGGAQGGGYSFGRQRSSSISSVRFFHRLATSVGVVGPTNLAVFVLWPTSALAASHLRVNSDMGFIEELPEDQIADDVMSFHVPVQHPGGQAPATCVHPLPHEQTAPLPTCRSCMWRPE